MLANVAPHAGAWIETNYNIKNFWRNKSHLMQVRELKPLYRLQLNGIVLSHLMQVRELKPIESTALTVRAVAPHAGAWIETCKSLEVWNYLRGRTSCRCVNWNLYCLFEYFNQAVAPHAGAWIETSCSVVPDGRSQSHLMQVRELKHFWRCNVVRVIRSHLMQVRELKLISLRT